MCIFAFVFVELKRRDENRLLLQFSWTFWTFAKKTNRQVPVIDKKNLSECTFSCQNVNLIYKKIIWHFKTCKENQTKRNETKIFSSCYKHFKLDFEFFFCFVLFSFVALKMSLYSDVISSNQSIPWIIIGSFEIGCEALINNSNQLNVDFESQICWKNANRE